MKRGLISWRGRSAVDWLFPNRARKTPELDVWFAHVPIACRALSGRRPATSRCQRWSPYDSVHQGDAVGGWRRRRRGVTSACWGTRISDVTHDGRSPAAKAYGALADEVIEAFLPAFKTEGKSKGAEAKR